ncbi:glycoside hydrolase family 3 C-terminal domain-containing protein, partial [Clostridium perfringens]
CVTPEQGFRAAMGHDAPLKVERGSDYEVPLAGGIERAVAAVKASDVVVLVIGESARMSGEAQARVEITVPEAQLRLAEAIA